MKIKKKLMTFAAVICCSVTLYAQQLTEQEAMERAMQYMNRGKSFAQSRNMAAPANGGGMKLDAAPVEAEKIYAFNMEGGGYVIASADSRTLPVLGYSTTGSLDWEQMPDNMRSWLKHYDEAIATLGSRADFLDGELTSTLSYAQGATTALQSRRAGRTAVEPLIKTHWGQEAPYWDQVPTYQGPEAGLRGKQCYTGCVATAMAQVMNYWQWPTAVPDGLPDYDYDIKYNGSKYMWHLGALPPTRFEWELMINDYYVKNIEARRYDPIGTDEQRRAVATLMHYCGQSLEMMYGPAEKGGSEALYCNVACALVNYFDYNAAQHIERRFFSDIDTWEDIIYSELAAGRPVVYGGQSDSGGHAFVCDGYDGDGLFHINWGWDGGGDAYFALAVLNPYNNISAGSGSSGIGFCIDENATIYTDPKMEPQPSKNGESVGRIYQYVPIRFKGNEAATYYSYFETDEEEADFALGTVDAEGKLQPLFMSDEEYSNVVPYNECSNSYYIVKFDTTMFTTGQTVTLYPMVRFRHPGEEWQFIPPVEQNLTVGLDEDGRFFMRSNQKTYDMQLTNVAITKGTGRLNERSDITIRVRNNEGSDYVNNLNLVPVYLGHITPEEYDISPKLAEGTKMICGAYIPAGSEADVTFSFVPEYGGTVVFSVSDNSGQYVGRMPLELLKDTLTNYDAYLENKSYLSSDDDQWYWNVELADRIGVKMPHWIPSDSLYLTVCHNLNNEQVKSVRENTGLKEYLAALPDSIGTGNYTFSYQIPVEVGQPGEYYFNSCLAEIVNKEVVNDCCIKDYIFTIDDNTGIDNMQEGFPADKSVKTWFDLQGRRLDSLPQGNEIFIMEGKKTVVRINE